MTREEHTQKIRDIQDKIKDIDDGSITEILADLSDDYGTQLSKMDTIELEKTKLKNDNDNLRDTNMRLFLKVGDKVLENKDNNTNDENTPETEDISINDLFNEKGELI